MSAHLDRAMLLYDQSRHELAEQELKQALAADPDNATAHALLGLCQSKREQFADATRETQMAVHLAPTLAFAHYALASVYYDRDWFPEAEKAIAEAIRLNPEDADYYWLRGAILHARRQWQPALDAAEEGLRVDPENVNCNNLRARCLVMLGRNAEAGATIESALAKDPENAWTHANQGWALLDKGDPAKALEHFREALRLDPELEWARHGIVEALKARHLVYYYVLRYFLWMAKLQHTAQWAVIIGGYLGYRVLLSVAENQPQLKPWVGPIQGVYVGFVLLTWIADPLFNLVLRLNRFGRLALSREQIVESNWIGTCVGLTLASLLAWAITGDDIAMHAALLFGLLIIPLAGTFNCSSGWPRQAMTVYTALMAAAGFAALALLIARSPLFLLPGAAFLLGAFLSSWVANALQMARVRR